MAGGTLHFHLLSTQNKDLQPQWFTQKVDHFNTEDSRVFQQKYFVKDEYFKSQDGPVFLYLSGEAPLYGTPKEGSFVDRLARRHGALLIALEHRFYGDSIPFERLTINNLQYLTTRQALLDVAAFRLGYADKLAEKKSQLDTIESMPQEFGMMSENPWVTFGGSYAGALAAWFRLKFPHLTRGSLASSAVIEAVLDYSQFDEQVGKSAGQECAAVMRKVSRQVDQQLDGGDDSNDEIKQLFEATEMEDNDFRFLLADAMAMAVQYGYKGHICDPLLDAEEAGTSVVDAAANYTKDFFYPTLEHGGPKEYSTTYLADVTADPDKSGRQWWYQKCSELGLFQTAPSIRPVRSRKLDMDYFRKACKEIFGSEHLWPKPNAFNKYYGGKFIDAGNIYFTNGAEDPWLHASITEPVSITEPARLIECEGCGHCVDLKTPTPKDPPQLVDARQDVDRYLKTWLAIGNA